MMIKLDAYLLIIQRYVINDQKKHKKYDVYVGETNDIKRRTVQHIQEDPKKREDFLNFNKSDSVQMFIMGHVHFNKSLTLDIENRLMQYLNGVEAVNQLNNRRHNEQNIYYDSEELDKILTTAEIHELEQQAGIDHVIFLKN